MRVVFIFIVLLMLIGLSVPVMIVGRFWSDGDSVVTRAQMSGTLRAPTAGGRLTMAERTIAMDQFPDTWRASAFPCRTLAYLWADLMTDRGAPDGTPVSQKVASTLLADRNATSVRWQLRRFAVACQLERRFDDAQLLRVWLTTASFGQNAVGLEAASQAIFQKPSRELNAEESAKLAALLHAPSLRNQPERWTQRAQEIQARVAPR